MRIVLISYHGLADYTIGLANSLAESHHVMLVLASVSAKPFVDKIHPDIDFVEMDYPRLRNPVNLMLAGKVMQTVADFQPDVVHFQSGLIWYSFFIPWLKKWPLVTTIHDIEPHAGDWLSDRTKWFLPIHIAATFSDSLIVHSDFVRSQLESEFKNTSDRIHRVFQGDGFLYTTIEHGFLHQKFDALFFGRIMQYKGIQTLIDAIPHVVEEYPDFKLCIAGDGDVNDLTDHIQANAANVELYNQFIDPALASNLFQNSKLVILPYTHASQSGVVPLAYSFGRPVIATRVGGLPEIVEHEQTGWLIQPNDDRQLADAILDLLKNDSKRKEMGERAIEKVHQTMSWEHAAAETIQVYQQAISIHADR